MEHIILQYISKNGIRLHHLLSNNDNSKKGILKAETHVLYEIFYLISGKVQYSINGKIYNIPPKSIAIVPKNTLHSVVIENNLPCERISLLFSDKLFPSFNELDVLSALDNAKNFSYVLPKKIVEEFNLDSIIKKCEERCGLTDTFIDLDLTICLLQLIKNTNKAIDKILSEKNYLQHSVKIYTVSHNCIQYVNKHISEKITLKHLANALNLSESHIRQTFKKETGTTLSSYIQQQKVQYAHQLLSEGMAPSLVALELGYDYYSTFYDHYVKRFNIPPRAFAKVDEQRLWENDVPITQLKNKSNKKQ